MDIIKLLLKSGGKIKILCKEEVLFREEETAHHFYMVKKGKVKIVNNNDDGKEFIQAFFTDNMSFGEAALFNNGKYPATAIAMIKTEIVHLEKSLYLELLRTNFEFHYTLTASLAMRLRLQINKIKSLNFDDAEDRILNLFDQLRVAQLGLGNDFQIDYTRREIGELTGLRTETVIRMIKKMEKCGKIKLVNKKIIIKPKI